jgi:glycosyltransferase involved in cell wall biosynthesis
VVLTVFDARSGFNRKNPIAAVRAFRQANRDGRAVMVCKATGVEGAPDLVASLRQEIGEAGDVRLMTDWLTGRQMGALIASADIVLSLHRSEGFGLLPAQGMAAGKAVVATGWSANLDFMTPDNSVLVDYILTPVRDSQGLYAGGRWAEADVEDAAAKLAVLFADPDRRRALGARAAADVAAIGRLAMRWLGGDQRREQGQEDE